MQLNRSIYLIAGGLTILITACNTQKSTTEVMANEKISTRSAKDTLIRWSNGGCFGQCPIFTLDIREDGLIYYHGRRFVKKEGKHELQLSENELLELKSVFENAAFSSLDTTYISEIVDVSTTRIAYEGHRVVCRGEEPMAYKAIKKYLNKLMIDYDLIDNVLYRDQFPLESGIIIQTNDPLDYLKVIAKYPEYELLHGRNVNKDGTIVLLHTLHVDKREEIMERFSSLSYVKGVQANRSIEKRG